MTREEYRFELAAAFMQEADMSNTEAKDYASFFDDTVIDWYIHDGIPPEEVVEMEIEYWSPVE